MSADESKRAVKPEVPDVVKQTIDEINTNIELLNNYKIRKMLELINSRRSNDATKVQTATNEFIFSLTTYRYELSASEIPEEEYRKIVIELNKELDTYNEKISNILNGNTNHPKNPKTNRSATKKSKNKTITVYGKNIKLISNSESTTITSTGADSRAEGAQHTSRSKTGAEQKADSTVNVFSVLCCLNPVYAFAFIANLISNLCCGKKDDAANKKSSKRQPPKQPSTGGFFSSLQNLFCCRSDDAATDHSTPNIS